LRNLQPMPPELFKTFRAAFLAAALPVLLVACGSPAPRPEPEAPRDIGTVDKKADKPAPSAKRGGGYYLDDGPGDNPPPNLEAVPDAQPRLEPLHRVANNPYAVLGRSYVPEKKLKPYKKRGVASWYGRRFHGRKTSIGETYDMYAMTAAHPTLPIPSYARVTNVASGKAVVVRVNDRGPFLSSRIVDLSYTAAYKLGYSGKGSTLVDVETLIPGHTMMAASKADDAQARVALPTALASASATPAADRQAGKGEGAAATLLVASAAPAAVSLTKPEDKDPLAELIAAADEAPSTPLLLSTVKDRSGTFLQLAAFSSKDGAQTFRDHLLKELDWLSEKIVIQPKAGMFRLRAGPYSSVKDAAHIADRIRRTLSLKPFVVAP